MHVVVEIHELKSNRLSIDGPYGENQADACRDRPPQSQRGMGDIVRDRHEQEVSQHEVVGQEGVIKVVFRSAKERPFAERKTT